jgi:uncharacterized protein (DUF4213/DUF364 family)
MILELIKEKAIGYAKDLTIVDFSFGLPYTYVVVKGKNGFAVGVSMTLPEEIQKYENSINEVDLINLVEKIDSLNLIERTLALAAVNAISQYYIDISRANQSDVDSVIQEQNGKIAIIGDMPPIVKAAKENHKEIYIFERNPKLWSKEILSDALEYTMLPKMDVVLSTAACLVNNTVDLIVERAKKASVIFLIGATGQLLPSFLRNTGITHIASMKVTNINKAINALKLGNYREFVKSSQKYIFKIS